MILLRRRHTEELGLVEDLKQHYEKRYSKCSTVLCTLEDLHIVMKHFMGDKYILNTSDTSEGKWVEIKPPSSPYSKRRFHLAKRYIRENKQITLWVNFLSL